MNSISARQVSVAATLFVLGVLSSCSSMRYDGGKWLGLGKKETEYHDPNASIRVPNFELLQTPADQAGAWVSCENTNKIRIAEVQYHHPVDGTWRWLGWFGQWVGSGFEKPTQELVLFVGLATSNDPDKLKSFAQGVLAKGLTADEKAISERKHDWIRATDFLKREATVPAGISVDFVLAYAGEVNPGTANIISEFEVKDRGGRGAENKAGEGFDLVVLGGQYSFLWMLVLEETGDRTLRRIKKDTDDKLTGRSLLLALFPLSWPDLAEEVLGKAANYAVQVVIENAPKASGEFPTYSIPSVGPVPVDYEYYFASEPGAQQIPLEHKRKWLEDGSISFELRLEAVP